MSEPHDDLLASMGPADFERLAQEYGTPYYLYDADAVNRRIEAVRAAFGGLVQVYYAVKCNPNLGLLKALEASADGLDISSGGELDQALLAGYAPERLSFAGPAKTAAELEASIRHGVGCISVESRRELDECVRLASAAGLRARVSLRVNPLLLNRSFGLKMGGKAVQFGLDEESLDDILATVAARADALDFQGVHLYAGSQSFDAAGVAEGVVNTLRIVRDIEARSPLVCRTINLGGGFGVSHGEADKQLDLAALATALRPAIEAFHAESAAPRRVVFELGRYLMAAAGLYVARVVSSKTSRGKDYVMVDGGLHHHLAAAGTFGAALRANFPLRNLSRPDGARRAVQVAGPSCNPTDLLGIDAELAQPALGDLIGVLKSGAYGFTASPLLFLGRRTPAELVRHRGAVTVGRRARDMTDFN